MTNYMKMKFDQIVIEGNKGTIHISFRKDGNEVFFVSKAHSYEPGDTLVTNVRGSIKVEVNKI